jgi:hypothetical protein
MGHHISDIGEEIARQKREWAAEMRDSRHLSAQEKAALHDGKKLVAGNAAPSSAGAGPLVSSSVGSSLAWPVELAAAGADGSARLASPGLASPAFTRGMSVAPSSRHANLPAASLHEQRSDFFEGNALGMWKFNDIPPLPEPPTAAATLQALALSGGGQTGASPASGQTAKRLEGLLQSYQRGVNAPRTSPASGQTAKGLEGLLESYQWGANAPLAMPPHLRGGGMR